MLTRPCPTRGFSLIEVMAVVAILGIVAALAIPNLFPEVQKARVESATEAVAAFVARARLEAMVTKRCVRVLVDADGRGMTAERLDDFNCDPAPDAVSNWVPLSAGGDIVLDAPSLRISLSHPPASTNDEIRFRPNGRIWHQSEFIADPPASPPSASYGDLDAALYVELLGGTRMYRYVVVKSNGLIFTTPRGELPGVDDENGGFLCPP